MRITGFKEILILVLLIGVFGKSHAHTDVDKHEDELVDLVFALDDSGSLGEDDFRLQQEGFKNAFDLMRDQGLAEYVNTVSVIYFGTNSVVEVRRSEDFDLIYDALSIDYNGGSTNITAALNDATSIFNSTSSPDGNGHVINKLLILSTDGRVNSTAATTAANNLKQNDVHFASIKVGDSSDQGVVFLNGISDNNPIPTPANFTEFGLAVSELILTQFSEVIGIPVVTQFETTVTDSTVEFSCEGLAIGYESVSYQLKYFGKNGELLTNNKVSPVVGQPALDTYSFTAGEGVYHAECTILGYRRGTTDLLEIDSSNPRKARFAIAFDDTDSDGDGLPDSWETRGLFAADGVTMLLDLPAMGASAECKDVFVEVDWLVNEIEVNEYFFPGVGQVDRITRPNSGSLEKVITAFAEAPVTNIGGSNCKGINLHIDAGEDLMLEYSVVENAVVSTVGSYVSGGNAILDNDKSIEDELYSIEYFAVRSKAAFSTVQETHFDINRNGVFRYALMVSPRALNELTGYAYTAPGAGFFAVGESLLLDIHITDIEIASNFMHELGHSLGLGHGGIDENGFPDSDNYKPNYLSVMNYHYNPSGLFEKKYLYKDFKRIDYSRWSTADLLESSLDETIGVQLVPIAGDTFALSVINDGISIEYSCSDDMDDNRYVDAKQNAAIDWNCDGDSLDSNVSANINAEDDKLGISNLEGRLKSDWAALSYKGHSAAGVGIITTFEAFNDSSLHTPEEYYIEPSLLAYSINIDSDHSKQVLAGSDYELDFKLENIGGLSDTYSLEIESTVGLQNVTISSSELSLDSNQQSTVQVGFTIPSSALIGDIFTISFNAVSNSNSVVSDSADIKLEVQLSLFEDTSLLSCVNSQLGLELTSIPTVSQLATITSLYCDGAGIISLEGISKLTQLQDLVLSRNEIEDISPLSELINLEYLYMDQNNISDVSALSGLQNLYNVTLSNNQIIDLSPLISLSSLSSLNVHSNEISDISVLVAMTNLYYLDLAYNNISEITTIGSMSSLQWLYLGGNIIEDITSLQLLKNIKRLDLSYNLISNISSLSILIELTFLNLSNNDIENINAMQNLINLEDLWVWDNKIQDISMLANFTNLETLDISRNEITDLSALIGLSSLQQLGSVGNCISDFSGLGDGVDVRGYDDQRDVEDCASNMLNSTFVPGAYISIIDYLLSDE